MSRSSKFYYLIFASAILFLNSCSKESTTESTTTLSEYFEINIPEIKHDTKLLEQDGQVENRIDKCCNITSIEDGINIIADPSTYNGIGVEWIGAYSGTHITVNYKIYYISFFGFDGISAWPALIFNHTFDLEWPNCRMIGSGLSLDYPSSTSIPSGLYQFVVTLKDGRRVCTTKVINIQR